MKNINEDSVILNTKTTSINTYKFTVVYADGSGILCKICTGDNILVQGLIEKEYQTIQGTFLGYEKEQILIKDSNSQIYKFKTSELTYIYNISTVNYNFIITDDKVDIPDVVIPDDPSHSIASIITIANTGTGYKLISSTGDNMFNMKSIKEGNGIKIISNYNEIVISASIDEMNSEDIDSFINTHIK